MTTLPLFPETQLSDDHTPLPLLVAKKWGFPLAFHNCGGQILVRDSGLGERFIR